MLRYTPQRMVAGVLAVAVLLAGARWGAKFGVPPVYIGDVLVFCAIVNLVVRRIYSPAPHSSAKSEFQALKYLVWIVLYCAARFILSGAFEIENIRDFVPYGIYVAIGVMSGMTVGDASTRDRTFRVVYIALGAHAVWVFAVSILKLGAIRSPFFGAPIFETRPDFDYPMTAVFAALVLVKIYTSHQWRIFNFGLLGMSWATILLPVYVSRASILGSLAASGAVLVAIMSSRKGGHKRWVDLTAAALPLATVAAIPAFASSSFGEKLLSTFDSDASTTNNGYATASARREAWEQLYEWTNSDITRGIFGEGFSTNIMAASGAGDKLALGYAQGDVRAPHNYWANTHAHIGYVGVVLVAIPIIIVMWSFYKNRRILFHDQFRLACYLIPIGMLMPATFGVILESPFGAIPFWWCVGAILVLDRRDSDAREAAEQAKRPPARRTLPYPPRQPDLRSGLPV